MSNPIPGMVYEHDNGNLYQVMMITNQQTTRPEQYPVTVVYFNIRNGTTWSRPVSEWDRSFSLRRSM